VRRDRRLLSAGNMASCRFPERPPQLAPRDESGCSTVPMAQSRIIPTSPPSLHGRCFGPLPNYWGGVDPIAWTVSLRCFLHGLRLPPCGGGAPRIWGLLIQLGSSTSVRDRRFSDVRRRVDRRLVPPTQVQNDRRVDMIPVCRPGQAFSRRTTPLSAVAAPPPSPASSGSLIQMTRWGHSLPASVFSRAAAGEPRRTSRPPNAGRPHRGGRRPGCGCGPVREAPPGS
jgi:hypothetical protein